MREQGCAGTKITFRRGKRVYELSCYFCFFMLSLMATMKLFRLASRKPTSTATAGTVFDFPSNPTLMLVTPAIISQASRHHTAPRAHLHVQPSSVHPSIASFSPPPTNRLGATPDEPRMRVRLSLSAKPVLYRISRLLSRSIFPYRADKATSCGRGPLSRFFQMVSLFKERELVTVLFETSDFALRGFAWERTWAWRSHIHRDPSPVMAILLEVLHWGQPHYS
jgi:hypothetical protein